MSLAPGGPGNLDVTELDAASHNGVDDMRELREKAHYAPAESRYRVFIIDEAHMITPQGFNAMLKIVEEPPEHLIFIFATTEPDKVIGTIRSRTHHYPFRLLTPGAMRGLLERTCRAEGVHVDDAVYPLVIRAGGGSPRDSLSILDQLLAGAGPDGLSYESALPLLGVTDFTLIDAAITALATDDKAGMFATIDRVIEAGHDPRRFATDLLDRLRDLMILQTVPEAFDLGLVDAPTDRAQVLTDQAAMFSGNELATLASMVNTGLADLRGATSPRLLLEILCVRLLLSRGQVAQVIAPAVGATQPAAAGTAPTFSGPGGAAAAARAKALAASQSYGQRPEPKKPEPEPVKEPEPAPAPEPAPEPVKAPEPAPVPEPAPEPEPATPAVPTADLLPTIRSKWAQLRTLVGKENIRTEIMLTEAKVLGIRQDTLVLGHSTGALANRLNAPEHNEVLVTVLERELGTRLAVECVVGTDPSAVGFTTTSQPEQPTWNPTRPTPQEQSAQQQMPSQPQESRQHPKAPAPAAAPDEPEEPESPAPRSGGWGEPVKIGDEQPVAPPAAPTPVTPPAPTPRPRPEAESKLSWRERAEQAAANATAHRQAQQGTSAPFSGGVPLPPEPEDYPIPGGDPYDYSADEGIPQRAQQATPATQEPQPPADGGGERRWASQSEEEEMMREAAREPGEMDRRDAKTIAMELLASELGAKPL
ncbi:DNA polymerase III, subunit gamma and tau [Corynebacterium efficiens YS-314]|nr:DNA polymerase III, subunit gamma and tau [Corynebacterium efficiens YS-314]